MGGDDAAGAPAQQLDPVALLQRRRPPGRNLITAAIGQAHQRRLAGSPTVLFTQFSYQTTQSWPPPRLVIGKAEYTALGPNPRFLVTSIGFDPGLLYRQGYCARTG